MSTLVLIVYLPSLHYGFLWDDPLWFNQPQQLSHQEIWLAPRTVQYYRPLTLELNLLLAKADKTHDGRLHHALQIGAHLVSVGLLYLLAGQVGLGRLPAVAAAALLALHPFSHQAVAWTAPQQPISTAFGLLSLVLYCLGRRRRQAAWIWSSLIAAAVSLLIIESSIVFCVVILFLEGCCRRRVSRTPYSRWPLAYGAMALLFAVLWQSVPKLSSLRGEGWDLRVLLYLLQGLSYPVLSGIGQIASLTESQSLILVGAAGTAVLVWLSAALWRGRRLDILLLGLAFLGPNLLIMWKELSYVYAGTSSRVFYPSVPGVALLWGALIALPIGRGRRRLWTLLSLLLVTIVAISSIVTVAGLNRLYAVGARHMDRLIDVIAQPEQRLLFVNFPDRLSLRPASYPLGYWGMILAPVSVSLGDYARLTRGAGAESQSLSAIYMAANLPRWPYQVDIRGAIASTQDVRQAVLWADRTYLTEYQLDGTLLLREASTLSDVLPDDEPLAVWVDAEADAVAYLRSIKIDRARGAPGLRTSDPRFPPVPGEFTVVLIWECVRPARPQDTIFVHLYRSPGSPPLNNYDGDPVLRLLPMASWQAGDRIRDVRYLDLSPFADPDDLLLGVGVYNWLKGERLAATDAHGIPLADDVFYTPLRVSPAAP